jgi:hypothetical protein
MSQAIEALRPEAASAQFTAGWVAHKLGYHRGETRLTRADSIAEWECGWDARHRLSVIESSGCGRLVP